MPKLLGLLCLVVIPLAVVAVAPGEGPRLIESPDAHATLVNPACSHCRDEAARRAKELRADDRVLCWTREYSLGGAIPYRFFLNRYRVISDSYGVFVLDPEAGFARGFAPSFEFRFHGWRNGVLVMQHKDGTLFSALSGRAFAGPRKGTQLAPVPTLVSDWGPWLRDYPDAVAYRMVPKYQPVELASKAEADSVRSRAAVDARLPADEAVLGVWTGKTARAYPLAQLERKGLLLESLDGHEVLVLYAPETKTASAYRPTAVQPRKFKAPAPDETGVSKPDAGVPLAKKELPNKPVTLALAEPKSPGRFVDVQTKSYWDVAGRCVAGELKGWELQWLDSVQVKWFAWSAEWPTTSLFSEKVPEKPKESAEKTNKLKEIAGTAEFLRLLPKPFATIKAIDTKNARVTLLLDGEKEPKSWPVEPDAEIKIEGWWGRLEQLRAEQRVWVWLKLDRKKQPTSVVMIADELSEYELHGRWTRKPDPKPKFSVEEIAKRTAKQKSWLNKRWDEQGLPATVIFHHVFSGEVDLMFDHEAMRRARGLRLGDEVLIAIDTPIKGIVKTVEARRERTMVRLVVGELESSELKLGQRVFAKIKAALNDDENYPADIDRVRSSAERVEWVLANVYCTCKVRNNTCTGHFYTLASCNPNGCGQPNAMREQVRKLIDEGKSDRQIFDVLKTKEGELLTRPHLLP